MILGKLLGTSTTKLSLTKRSPANVVALSTRYNWAYTFVGNSTIISLPSLLAPGNPNLPLFSPLNGSSQ